MEDSFAETLATAGQVFVGINARHGPHVTPELFTVSAGRVWCLTAATTLKARRLADGGRVALAARGRDTAAVAAGSAVVLDPARPTRSAAGAAQAIRSPLALAKFVMDNAGELSGAVTDAFAGKLGRPLPPHRVLLCIEPDATATIDADGNTTAEGWPNPTAAPVPPQPPAEGGSVPDLLADVPENIRQLTGTGPAYLGWVAEAGDPIVLPVAWDAEAQHALVAEHFLRATCAAATSRAAVTRDDWSGFGPSGKQGIMLRGEGRICDRLQGRVIEIATDGVTYWDGVDTGSV